MSTPLIDLYVTDFHQLTKLQQIDVCASLFDAFLDEMIDSHVTSVTECIEAIQCNFSIDSNRFFVMYTTPEKQQLVSFLSIDFIQWTRLDFPTLTAAASRYPCVSNVFVHPSFRKQHIATAMMDMIVYYCHRVYPETPYVCLWCYASLLPFYQSIGWIFSHQVDNKHYLYYELLKESIV